MELFSSSDEDHDATFDFGSDNSCDVMEPDNGPCTNRPNSPTLLDDIIHDKTISLIKAM